MAMLTLGFGAYAGGGHYGEAMDMDSETIITDEAAETMMNDTEQAVEDAIMRESENMENGEYMNNNGQEAVEESEMKETMDVNGNGDVSVEDEVSDEEEMNGNTYGTEE